MLTPAAFTSGALLVYVTNACGAGAAKLINIFGKPSLPVISGPVCVLSKQLNLVYSAANPQAGVTYNWKVLSTGGKITSGQGTSSVTVKWGTVSGSVSVAAINSCGNSARASMSVTVGCAGSTIAKNEKTNMYPDEQIIVYPNPATNIATVVFNAQKEYRYALELTDVTGKVLLRKESNSIKGKNMVTIDVSKYTRGMYFINLVDSENGRRSLKLNKQ